MNEHAPVCAPQYKGIHYIKSVFGYTKCSAGNSKTVISQSFYTFLCLLSCHYDELISSRSSPITFIMSSMNYCFMYPITTKQKDCLDIPYLGFLFFVFKYSNLLRKKVI